MPREARKLTTSALDGLDRKAVFDPAFMAYVADAGRPGLYAWPAGSGAGLLPVD